MKIFFEIGQQIMVFFHKKDISSNAFISSELYEDPGILFLHTLHNMFTHVR